MAVGCTGSGCGSAVYVWLPTMSLILLVTGLIATIPSASAAVRYDQTQTGGTNVHLQIKNVEVLALLDDTAGSEVSSQFEYLQLLVVPYSILTHNVTYFRSILFQDMCRLTGINSEHIPTPFKLNS